MGRHLLTSLFAACVLASTGGCNCPPADTRGFDIDREVTVAELETFVAEHAGYEDVEDVECEDLCTADIQQEAGRTVEAIESCELESPPADEAGTPGRLRCAGDSFAVCEG